MRRARILASIYGSLGLTLALSCGAPSRAPAPAGPRRITAKALAEPGLSALPLAPSAPPPSRCLDPAARKPTPHTRYPFGMLQSPMTEQVVYRISAMRASSTGRRNVFMKVGDSITISNHFLKCFVEDTVDLGDYPHLEATLKFFGEVPLGPPKTSFDRASMATCVGWTARDPRLGGPSPLDKEIAGTRPGFAIIMFGTNGSNLDGIFAFERDLLADIDLLLDRGIIPLMSTVPPKIGKPESMAAIPEMNVIVRAIAQARQVPLMDFNLALQHLPDWGLAEDGVHPRPYLKKYVAHGCWLNADALQAGMNVRNLVTLTALDRVRRFVLEKEAPEPEPPALQGHGTSACPWVVDRLPFVDAADTTEGDDASRPGTGCRGRAAGALELVYSIRVDRPGRVRVRLFTNPGVVLQLYWMNDRSPSRCVAEGDREMELQVEAGLHRLVVSTVSSNGPPRPGGYRLTVVPVD
jgi:hypothetical protein